MIAKKINLPKCLLYFAVGLLLACNPVPDEVSAIILTSPNKAELEKAIEHYRKPEDKMKLKALYYILGNIHYKQYKEGIGVDNYEKLFEELKKTPENKKEWLSNIFDSLMVANGNTYLGATFPVRDVNAIKAQFLINHIDAACIAWQKPWAKKMSFNEFSEYILPYKLLEEKPDSWMQNVRESYKYLKLDTDDPYKACLIINDELKRRFKIRSIPSFTDLNYSQLEGIKSGKCNHATQYTAYVMRSLGIPVTIDYAIWGI